MHKKILIHLKRSSTLGGVTFETTFAKTNYESWGVRTVGRFVEDPDMKELVMLFPWGSILEIQELLN